MRLFEVTAYADLGLLLRSQIEGIKSCRYYGPLRLRLLPLQCYYRPPSEEYIQWEPKQAWETGSHFRARVKKRLPHDSARRRLPQATNRLLGHLPI